MLPRRWRDDPLVEALIGYAGIALMIGALALVCWLLAGCQSVRVVNHGDGDVTISVDRRVDSMVEAETKASVAP